MEFHEIARLNKMVSVIIPNFNHGKYLQQRINSILLQSINEFEIIILDDGSTDDSQSIIEQFRSHPKVTRIDFNTKNSGNTFSQWEKGIAECRGEFIWIAESDDYSEGIFLETLVKEMEGDLSVSIAYCQSYIVDDQEHIHYISKEQSLSAKIDGRQFIQSRMTDGNSIFNASMAVFRKSALDLKSKPYLDFKFCGDWLFWIELAKNSKVFISGKVLNYYRKHTENLTTRYSKSGIRYVEDLKILFLLVDQGIIDETLFKSSLKKRFLTFNSFKNYFDTNIREELESMFLTDKRTKKYSSGLKLNLVKEKVYRTVSNFARMVFGK